MRAALVTGASQGLGLGFVEALHHRGFKVFAGVRKFNPEIEKRFPDVEQITLLLDDADTLASAVTQISDRTSSLDIIVNNGALSRKSPELGGASTTCVLKDLDRASLLKMFEVNAIAPLMLIKQFLPLLKNDPSYLIQISSARGSLYTDETPNSSANYGYRGSKAALTMMTRALIHDLPSHIRTFAVHPGLVKTSMNPEGKLTPIESAQRILSIPDRWQPSMHGNFLNNEGAEWPR